MASAPATALVASILASILAAAIASLAACQPTVVFRCESSAQCALGDVQGTCQQVRFCSLPDSSCASGQRFDETAGDGLADQCVPGDAVPGDGGGADFDAR